MTSRNQLLADLKEVDALLRRATAASRRSNSKADVFDLSTQIDQLKDDRERISKQLESTSMVGQIFHSSYGYDMTINIFVLVVGESDHTVLVQKIGSNHITGGGYTGVEQPDATKIIGRPFRLIKNAYGGLRGSDKSNPERGGLSSTGWTLYEGRPVYYNTMD